MEIKAFLEKTKPLIDKEIEKVFPRSISKKWLESALGKAAFAYDEKTLTKGMAEPIWEYLDRGGKRWRPGLAVLAAEAVAGKKITKKALAISPLVEMIHNGTIAVDDCEDDSELRRGKPCMHKIYGIDVAINDGNAMYFIPLILLYKNPLKLSEKQVRQIFDLYSQEMIRVSVGQAMDIWWHKGKKLDVSEEEYLQMCSYKTGVLARFAARLGGIVAGATAKQLEALGKFGETVGIAFQIQDDILNLVGEEFQKGKGVGEDIHEGKRTLLVIRALQKASEADKKRLLDILNSHPSDEATIREAIEIIKKYGGIEYAQAKAEELVKKAWKQIDSALKDSDAKDTLKSLAEYAVKRQV